MAWYDRMLGRKPLIVESEEKLNPAQQYYDHKTESSRELVFRYERAYEDIEIVNRGVNLIVDDAAEIPTTVGSQIQGLQNVVKGIKRSKVSLLLICLTPVKLSDIIHVNKLSIMTKHASEKAGFINSVNPVSYTHLTLPTNREV